MGFGERIELWALEIENADAAVLQQQRNHELRPRIVHHLDVARVDGHVGDVDRLLVQRRVADQTGSDLHARHAHFVAVPDRDLHFELQRVFIDEQDAERPVVDDTPREVCDSRKKLIEVQNRRELARDSSERLERRRVLSFLLEQPRVLDGHRDVCAELAEDRLVGFGELAGGVRQQIERADHAALAAQRHDELRPRSRDRLDVARLGVHVVDQQRTAFLHGGADQTMADFHAERARDIFRITDRIGDRQLVTPCVEQVHGECRKFREPRDELRDLRKQIVEVENRSHFAPERKERGQRLAGVGG